MTFTETQNPLILTKKSGGGRELTAGNDKYETRLQNVVFAKANDMCYFILERSSIFINSRIFKKKKSQGITYRF